MNVLLVATLLFVCSASAYPAGSVEDWPDYTSEELRLVPAYEREPLIQKRSTVDEKKLITSPKEFDVIASQTTSTDNIHGTASSDHPHTTPVSITTLGYSGTASVPNNARTRSDINPSNGYSRTTHNHDAEKATSGSTPSSIAGKTANTDNRVTTTTTAEPGTPTPDSADNWDSTTGTILGDETKEFPNQRNRGYQLNKIRP